MTLRPVVAALLLAAAVSPPANAAPAHVLAVTIDIYYDPVLPVGGCRTGRVSGYGTAVDPLATGVVLPFTYETVQEICATYVSDDYCAPVAGAVRGTLCVVRTLDVMTTSGVLTIDGHAHVIAVGDFAWFPTSMPPAAAVATGSVVLS